MSERARFFNRRSTDAEGEYTYSADEFAEYLNTFFSDGVVSSGLAVSGSGNRATVKSGYAVIAGHWYHNDGSLMLTNPTLSTLKRKDSIALKFDNEERSIKAVWITGSQETYPVLTDSSSIKYLLLANVELLPGGSVKSVTDKRKYCQALYTMSLEQFQTQFSQFIKNCSDTINKNVKNTTVNSEIISSRGGLLTLKNRLDVTDNKHLDIKEAGTLNLFDYRQAQTGWLDHSGSIEMSSATTNYFTTDYIPIENGIEMFAYNGNGAAVNFETVEFYRDRSSTGLIKFDGEAASSWVNDCNAAFVRLSFDKRTVAANNLIITISDTATRHYIPYRQIVKPSSIVKTQFGMDYITENVALAANETYAVNTTDIALSSPVKVHITVGGGNSVLVRADGEELIDKVSNSVVDGTMTDVVITAEDLTAGLELTQGGSLTVKYYNANCEDLLQMINSSGTGFTVFDTVYEIDNTTQVSTIFNVTEDN